MKLNRFSSRTQTWSKYQQTESKLIKKKRTIFGRSFTDLMINIESSAFLHGWVSEVYRSYPKVVLALVQRFLSCSKMQRERELLFLFKIMGIFFPDPLFHPIITYVCFSERFSLVSCAMSLKLFWIAFVLETYLKNYLIRL